MIREPGLAFDASALLLLLLTAKRGDGLGIDASGCLYAEDSDYTHGPGSYGRMEMSFTEL